ncbi:alpha/beta hydrolase [Hoyosella rhizosphaerae]|uniref:alpha/beta hydrolase n=1 Tax=Hoyosella rhizosphaerae TaxID=1755582 RepID=UPI00166382D7|nr:alpha/beta hydrolase [Hoyosella rhizosphaerae]MBN4926901.1 alpha/beta hydrolase [Hoyosella rhizosphaerae]
MNLDLAARGAARTLFSAPDPVWRLLAPIRPTIDGQRMTPRLQFLANIGSHDLKALRRPTPLKRKRMDVLMNLVGYVKGLDVAAKNLEVPGPAGPISARLYAPSTVESSGLLIYVHGGGWHLGSTAGFDGLSRFLADRGRTKVLSLNYRLAPEHPFPAAFDDVLAGFRFAVDQSSELGVDPQRIAIAGDSAGGNLAAAVALHLGDDEKYRPALAVPIYPVVDADVGNHRSIDLFHKPLDRGAVARAIAWYGSRPSDFEDPRCFVMAATDLSTMPPTYIATAGMDVLRDQGEAFAERLKDADADVTLRRFDNMPHGFVSMLVDPDARAATEEIAAVIRDRIGER